MAFSRFVFTLFSWPEYVWITYQRLLPMPSSIFCIAVIPSLPLTKQQVHEEVQELVHRPHERRDDQHGEDHDDRRVDQLLARRPADLGELDLNFLDELPCLPCPGHSAPHRC